MEGTGTAPKKNTCQEYQERYCATEVKDTACLKEVILVSIISCLFSQKLFVQLVVIHMFPRTTTSSTKASKNVEQRAGSQPHGKKSNVSRFNPCKLGLLPKHCTTTKPASSLVLFCLKPLQGHCSFSPFVRNLRD